MRRVLVIGGGLGGLAAAIEAREAGAEVTLLHAGQGAHHLFSGGIDLLAYPDPSGPAADNPLAAITQLAAHAPDHPYLKVGAEGVALALARMQRRLAEHHLTYIGDGRRQYRVLTAMGTLRLTGLTPLTMAIDPTRVEVVCAIGPYRNFSAGLVADGLQRRLGRAVRTLTFDLGGGQLDALGLAAKLAERATTEQFAEFLAAQAPGQTVALPAVLALDGVEEQKQAIENRFGGTLVETPGLPPSVPGLRLMRALRRIAFDLGVRLVQNARAVAPLENGGSLRGLRVRVGELERDEPADAVVMAPGHLVTGGLAGARGALREPLFHLPIGWRGDESFFRPQFLDPGGHPALQCGVMVDRQLRPLRGAEPAYANLFACGDILGGFDPYRERSGGGVALTTGALAGHLAAGGTA